MPIPPFQQIMRPLLALHADGELHSRADVVARLAEHFELTEAEVGARLETSGHLVFANRVAWATTDLFKAGLVERPARGVIRVTSAGQAALKSYPDGLDISALRAISAPYREFRPTNRRASSRDSSVDVDVVEQLREDESDPPAEVIDRAYQSLRAHLAAELLDRLAAQSPLFFEACVVDVLVAMGYGGSRKEAAERLGRAGDGGVDGVIKLDPLGLDAIYIQAKRWTGTVQRNDVQGFAGALQGVGAHRGVFITTSSFSTGARNYASAIPASIVLVDGAQLAELMIDHGVGVVGTTRYELKAVDEEYFIAAG